MRWREVGCMCWDEVDWMYNIYTSKVLDCKTAIKTSHYKRRLRPFLFVGGTRCDC